MLHRTPTATHRAAAGGACRPVRGPHRHRQQPPAVRRRVPREPERTAHWLARGLAALIALGVAVMVGILTLGDRRQAGPVDAGAVTAPDARLAERAGDPEPLSLSEVFPGPERVAGYRVEVSHVDAECGAATVGAVGPLLDAYGCTQVVRAALLAPFGDYRVTAGMFNLADAAGATAVDARLRALVETADGGFASLGGAPPADGEPAGQVGWRIRGHYLIYCVITRPGGELVTADDPNAARITSDLVDGYLGGSVLGRRAGLSA